MCPQLTHKVAAGTDKTDIAYAGLVEQNQIKPKQSKPTNQPTSQKTPKLIST